MRALTFHEEAGAEIIEAATYYEARIPECLPNSHYS